MRWLLALATGSAFIAAHVWWFQAMRHLSDHGRARTWRIMLWSKLFSGRENFTADGWRYWVRARWATVVFAALFLSLGYVWAGS